ncbi:MAG: SIR2 family protein [Propionibacteriaceae bacterium]|jgi:hypothetical protein|nr:SIR2 family protein [Propionibacteriaceae bacterium]
MNSTKSGTRDWNKVLLEDTHRSHQGVETLWITRDVDLPEQVVEAHSNGRLVFFVGAGASMNAPSSLPSFKRLAIELAEMAHGTFPEDHYYEPIDFFLGSLPDNFDTKTHAQRILAREDSTHNSTHSAIVRVASAVGPARIVTTNFDNHLASAAAAEKLNIDDLWIGPALPLGDNFAGIVHLHGSVLREPQELVLTDRDFGRAYLTDAWATRFLQRMFGEFTVVFVGYSLDDPIMRYLSLGLQSNTQRYVLTDRSDADKWRHLGVKTIAYPASDNHGALVAALCAWDSRARMGQLSHRTQMSQILDSGSLPTPVDGDYLVARIRTVDGAQDFAQFARGTRWLLWVEDHSSEFQGLFTGEAESPTARILSEWFCQEYVADPELTGAALQTVQRLGQHFGDCLFVSAGRATEQLGRADPLAAQRWKTLLATSIDGKSTPADLTFILPYKSGGQPEDPALLRVALRPFLQLERSWFPSSTDKTLPPNAELKWYVPEETLTAHVAKLIDDSDANDPCIRSLLEEALNSALDLLDGYFGGDNSDSLTFRRSSIAVHPQDNFREPIDALIDALRDFGEKALPLDPSLPNRWWAFKHALFQRLALHLIDSDLSRTPASKLQWILDRNLLYETKVKHETYQILATTVGHIDETMRAALLADILHGPEYPEDKPDEARHAAYATYNLLVWIAQHAPNWEEAIAAHDEIRTSNPDFEPREHPDLDWAVVSSTWGRNLLMEPEDFIRSADTDLGKAFDDLLDNDYSEHNFDEPSWDDALSLLRQVVGMRPDIGQRLWPMVVQRDLAVAKVDDLHGALIGGWTWSSLAGLEEPITMLVASEIENPRSTRLISEYLFHQIRQQIDSDESPATREMRQIACELWDSYRDSFADTNDSDNAPILMNSWPGEIAAYWLQEIDRRWRKNRENWSGLSDTEKAALRSLLDGPDLTKNAVSPVLARETFFLFAADEAFTTTEIFPLFLADNTASRAWSAYLDNPRCNDRMLGQGFLNCIVGEWDRLSQLKPRGAQDQFYSLVASCSSFAGITCQDRQRLLYGSILAENGVHAPKFAEAVVVFLRAKENDGAQVWDVWLRDHLSKRLAGLPRTASAEELERWADAVPYLGDKIPDAVSLLKNHQIGLGDAYHDPRISTDILTSYGPALVSHLADRVLNSSPTGLMTGYYLRKTIGEIKGIIGPEACQPLIAAAISRRFLSEDPQ